MLKKLHCVILRKGVAEMVPFKKLLLPGVAVRCGDRAFPPRPVPRESAGVRADGFDATEQSATIAVVAGPHPNPFPEYRARGPEKRESLQLRVTPLLLIVLGLCIVLAAGLSTAAPDDPPSATSPAATVPSTNPAKFSMNFKDAQLDAVLNYFSQTLGFEILQDGPIDARVTIMNKQPVSSEEALTMLIAALKVNGFIVIRDGNMLHIGSRDKMKKGNVPVHFGNDPAEVPDTDELITQVIPIQNVNAPKLRDDLKPIIGLDADISANEGSNTIIITDTSSAVRRVLEIISQIDQHESSVTQLRVVQLKHANASAVAKVIDSLFKNSSPQLTPQQQIQRQQQGQPPGGDTGGGQERHGATVVTASDDRTNTLLVTASSATLKLIDDIIARLDSDNPSPVAPVAVRYRVLKFAAADATAKLINSMFKQSEDTSNPYYYIYGNGRAGADTGSKEAPLVAVSDDRTNTVIVTGPPDRMESVDKLMDQLDTSPTVTQELRVIHLKYADAQDVASLVQDMFSPKKDQQSTSPFIYFVDEAPPDQQNVKGAVVKVSYDSRTNSVLVSAPKEMLDAVEKIVHQLDSDPATEDTMFIYHLRNSQSDHLAYTLNILFGNLGGANQSNNQRNGQQQQGQNNQNQQNQPNQNSVDNNSDNSNTGLNNGNSSNNQNSRNGQTAGRGGQVAQATNELTGKVLVVSEPDTNALLVTTASKYATQVRKIIDDLDRPVPQVLIKALIAEVSRDDSRDLGVDFSILNLRANGKGEDIGQTFGIPTDGLIAEVLETNITATLHALAVNGKLDVLSRPYILASDNQQATINVGQSVPFITQSRLDPVSNNEINIINYQDIGVILNVTPHINPDGLVILDVSPEVSSFTQSTLQLSQGVTSPIFQKRSANTRVGIMDGQTIVIGGLMQDQNTTTRSKIPLLGDLPLVGALFRRDVVDRTKTELLVFLTPHVAPQPDVLPAMSRDELKGTVLTPQAVAPGVYQQHLDGLDRGKAPATQPSTQPISPVKSIDLSDHDEKLE